jgi:hypothetical protein
MSSRAPLLREGSGDALALAILVASTQELSQCLLSRTRNQHDGGETLARFLAPLGMTSWSLP